MSGTFTINNAATWMPPNWCYNSILRAIAIRVQEIDPELADVIVNAQAETRSGYADLAGFGASWFAVLVAATERTLDSLLSDPSQLEPSEFTRLIPRLSELVGMLRCDTRAAPFARPPGHLRVSPDHRWSAPWWVFDVVVEQMGADIWSDDPLLSKLLFASRSGRGGHWHGFERLNSERPRTVR